MIEEQRVRAIDGGDGLAPDAADPAAARADPVELVGDPCPPLDEQPDVPRILRIPTSRAPPHAAPQVTDTAAEAAAALALGSAASFARMRGHPTTVSQVPENLKICHRFGWHLLVCQF